MTKKMNGRRKNRDAIKKWALLFLLLTTNLHTLYCAGPAPRDRSYTSFVEDISNIDTRPLAGRIIVIDPGHGGEALGAVGKGGLTEKDINLRTALRLRQYLEQADAIVVLTRDDDRAMIVSAYDSLRGDDLDYRVRIAEQQQTDLFISIHHNSKLPLDRNYNATETYYKMEDFYTSFDAARLIHKHLVRNIQTPESFLKPGNYYVLRNNSRTAVLGEASYISNPNVEKRLKKEEIADFEARSYFLGILDYFSRGIPRFTEIIPKPETVLHDANPVFKLTLTDDNFGDGIDHQSIIVGIDDEAIPFIYKDSQIAATSPVPLKNGRHALFANAVNLKGNHSVLYTSDFIVDMPPQNIIVSHTPSSIPPDARTPMKITTEITDKNLNPVRDGTPVRFTVAENPDLAVVKNTSGGTVNFYYAFGNPDIHHYTITVGNISHRGEINVRRSDDPIFVFRVINNFSRQEQGIDQARIGLNQEFIKFTNNDGYAYFTGIMPGNYDISVRKNGFYPADLIYQLGNQESANIRVDLKTVYNGVLFGRKIFIDPEFGGPSPGAVGPSGLQAAGENLQTAQYLVQLLNTAGANAILTRNRGEELTPYSRVRLANETGAELFISLRHEASSNPRIQGMTAYAYPTSRTGKRLGSLVLESIANQLEMPVRGPLEAADYVLQQTGCPALIVNLGYISNPETEEALYGTRYNRSQAFAIFTALVEFYAGNSINFGELSGYVKDENGNPVSNALIIFGGILIRQAENDGSFVFTHVESGEYTIAISAKGFSSITETVEIKPHERSEKNFKITR